MSITQEEMKSTLTAEIKANDTGFVNPFDPKFEMSLEEAAKVYAQNGSEGDKGPTGLAEPDSEEIPTKVTDDHIPTVNEEQDELLREYIATVILSSKSKAHHYIVDSANYILTDNSFSHEDALSVFKTLKHYFQYKYVRQ